MSVVIETLKPPIVYIENQHTEIMGLILCLEKLEAAQAFYTSIDATEPPTLNEQAHEAIFKSIIALAESYRQGGVYSI